MADDVPLSQMTWIETTRALTTGQAIMLNYSASEIGTGNRYSIRVTCLDGKAVTVSANGEVIYNPKAKVDQTKDKASHPR